MKYDVLIVGAGPVGLMLACELARRGISHLIIESKTERENYCKALGVSPRSLEIFDQLGVLDEILRRGFHFSGLNIVVGGQLVRRVEAQNENHPYGAFALAQPETEIVLEAYWARFGHRIQRGCSLLSFQETETGVSAVLSDGRVLEATYLVGCDGAHSTVRKALKAPFEGERYALTFLLGDVQLEWDHPHTENWQFIHMEDGELRNIVTVIANPTGPRRYRVSTAVDDGFECSEHPSLEVLQQVVGHILPPGTTMSDMRWSSRYNISHRIAGFYRKGRVFLAGDAAHIHPPIGGLGMNTGLQDAHNLGWKLAGVVKGQFAESVLESYHQERHPVGAKVVEVTAARMDRSMGGEAKPEPLDFDSQLRIRYPSGLLVGGQEPPEGLPRPGERLPAIEGLVRAHVFGKVRLPELFREGRFLLFLKNVEEQDFRRVAEDCLGEEQRCWTILDQEEAPDTKGSFLDPEGVWLAQIGEGAVLVRPDGMIAWRGNSAEELRSWFGRFVR